MKVFAVTRRRGPAWEHSRGLEEQRDWAGHAAFMDDLAAAGIVVFAGPLEGTHEALIIMRGESADEIAIRLERDPWTALDLLRTERVAPWTLRLGTLPG
jgi:uncharacterized protein YciI